MSGAEEGVVRAAWLSACARVVAARRGRVRCAVCFSSAHRRRFVPASCGAASTARLEAAVAVDIGFCGRRSSRRVKAEL
jgi:hypothetical protein